MASTDTVRFHGCLSLLIASCSGTVSCLPLLMASSGTVRLQDCLPLLMICLSIVSLQDCQLLLMAGLRFDS
jgi:hypothetical protein